MIEADEIPLRRLAAAIRGRVIGMSAQAKTAHLGSALSCVDILVAAYWKILRLDPSKSGDPLRDRLILSKGHAVSALYATLAERGFFPMAWLDQYNQPGGRLPEQPFPGCLPGVEAATGSLGHGLPLGTGMALAAKIRNQSFRVFVLMSDGECNEGAVWESAMFAPAKKLDNLCVMVDFNRWQATDRSLEVMSLEPLAEKFRAFGWDAVETDGHDIGSLIDALSKTGAVPGKPLAVIAHTVKGKGVSFMEDDNNWHYRSPNAEEVARARKELGLQD
ncbi:MAG: transketolase [Verrucomicrobiae bacterium]|nr:transketolase [Verrucomicrobiae bacterium]